MKQNISLKIIKPKQGERVEIPLVGSKVSAGFPSPAEDFVDSAIDLNDLLIHDKSSTYFAWVSGNSVKDIGVHDGDLLVINKAYQAKSKDLVVSYIDGEFTLKLIEIKNDHCFLLPANDDYEPIKISSENDFLVWGVVTSVIKLFRKK